MSEELIVARGLTKKFEDFVAVDGIDFSVAKGCLLYTYDAADDMPYV
jgi:ABC-type multidrug transport system ATPase subunit